MRSKTLKASRRLSTTALAALALAAGSPALAMLPPEPPPGAMAVGPAAEPVIVAPVPAVNAAIGADLAAAVAEAKNDPVAAGMAAFYAERENAPAWIDGARLSQAAVAALARIARADEDGLDAAAFPQPDPGLGRLGPESADALARADIAVSEAVARYALAAQAGRIAPTSISRLVTLKPERPDPVAVLRRVAAASDPAAALDGFNPPHEAFRRLKAALAKERAAEAALAAHVRPEPVAAGPTLSLGQRDDRVPALRVRLAVAPVEGDGAQVYDAALATAVAAFQAETGLAADGVLGARTLSALNGGESARVDRVAVILANMERWRWMPRDLGRFHVFVDIPAFTAEVVHDGSVDYTTRVVVGATRTPTPVFSDTIRFLVVNPYWNVPVSIASKEMLPAIRANPDGYFSRRNYEAVVDGRVVSPASIPWDEKTIRRVRIRQRPGDDNALGNIKFMFPNEHSVYLHDTPSKAFFEKPARAFSHGCVRVQDPLKFAEALLAEDPSLNARRIQRMIGGREARLDLKTPVPVHLAYFTAVADASGGLTLRHDVYGLDARMARALAAAP